MKKYFTIAFWVCVFVGIFDIMAAMICQSVGLYDEAGTFMWSSVLLTVGAILNYLTIKNWPDQEK